MNNRINPGGKENPYNERFYREQQRRQSSNTPQWLEQSILGGVAGGLLVGAGLFVLIVVSLALLGTGSAGAALALCMLFPIVVVYLIDKLR